MTETNCGNYTSVPWNCPRKMSGHLPFYGLTCDGCIRCKQGEQKWVLELGERLKWHAKPRFYYGCIVTIQDLTNGS